MRNKLHWLTASETSSTKHLLELSKEDQKFNNVQLLVKKQLLVFSLGKCNASDKNNASLGFHPFVAVD